MNATLEISGGWWLLRTGFVSVDLARGGVLRGRRCRKRRPWEVGLVCLCLLLAPAARADNMRIQNLQLQQGWNSVFLEVCPPNNDPKQVFLNTPVDIVAMFFPAAGSVEFVQNPSTINWNKDGWGVWYAPRRSDAFLSSLYQIQGRRAYLIHAEQSCTLSVQGPASLEALRWKSDSFNHVGFSLDPQSPPTFDKFFAGSAAHRNGRIFRLVNDKWTQVLNPITTFMRSGEAYWVYCKGGSDYQGPLSVRPDIGDGLAFLNQTTQGLTFANNSPDPMVVSVQIPEGTLPLKYAVRALSPGQLQDLAIDLPSSYRMATLEPGGTAALRLQVRLESLTQPVQSTVLRISTDGGVVFWVPAAACRRDLLTSP